MKTKYKIFDEVTKYNLKRYGVNRVLIADPYATAEQLEELLATAPEQFDRIELRNVSALPSTLGKIKHLEHLAISSKKLEKLPETLFSTSIGTISIVAPNVKNLPASIFNSEVCTYLVLSCLEAENTEKIVFHLPKLKALSLTLPKINPSLFQSKSPFEGYELNLNMPLMAELPSFLFNETLSKVLIKSDCLTDFPTALFDSPVLEILKLYAPIKGEIPSNQYPLRTIELQSTEVLDFSNCTLQISTSLNLVSKDGTLTFPKLTNNTLTFLVLKGFYLDEIKKQSIFGHQGIKNLTLIACKGIDWKELNAFPKLNHLTIGTETNHQLPYDDMYKELNVSTIRQSGDVVFENLEDFRDKKNKIKVGAIVLKDPTILLTKKPLYLHYNVFAFPIRQDLANLPILDAVLLGKMIAKASKIKLAQQKRLFLWFWKHSMHLVLPTKFPDLIALLSVDYELINTEVNNHLKHDFPLVKEIPVGATIFVNGTTFSPKKELYTKLETAGLSRKLTLTKDVTHILMASKPHVMDFDPTAFQYISEQQLKDYVKKQAPSYLETPNIDPAFIANVNQLLSHEDTTNQMLGLSLVQTGGLPESLFGKILVISKTSPEATVRTAARKALKTYGPERYAGLIKNRKIFHKYQVYPYQSYKFNLLEARLSIEEVFELNILLFKYDIAHLRYVLCHMFPDKDLLEEAVKVVIEKCGALNYSYAIGNFMDVELCDSASPENLGSAYFAEEFPVDKSIEHLILKKCRLIKFPEPILEMRHLKTLDLSENGLKKLPKEIANFQDLETLNIKDNSFKNFPKELYLLPNLKVLKIDRSIMRHELTEIKKQLPNCEF